MKRILKRFLFPTIITILVITILCLLTLNGGMYDDGFQYTTYQLMFGCNYKNGSVEFLQVNPLGVIVFILYLASMILVWFDFKHDKLVLSILFLLSAILTMLIPCTVNKTETANYLINAIESSSDKMMTILVGPYVVASICLVASCFSLFKNKFNSIFKITK